MNWKINVGGFLLLGAVRQYQQAVYDYRPGKFGFSPLGLEMVALTLGGLGLFLIVKGFNEKRIK